MRLEGKTVLVAGACGQIGRSLAHALVGEGANVAMGDVDEEVGQALLSELPSERALFTRLDISNADSVDEAIVRTVSLFGKLDGSVNAAYPRTRRWGTPFPELEIEDLSVNLRLQLGGALIFSQRTVKHYLTQGHGNLIHVSSIQGVAAPKFEHYEGTSMTSPIEYSAIKSGMIAITRYLAKYLAGKNIRVNCVSPGGILADQPEPFRRRYQTSCSSKGMLDSEDLNGAFLFLLSDESKYINGQNIVVDDGWSL